LEEGGRIGMVVVPKGCKGKTRRLFPRRESVGAGGVDLERGQREEEELTGACYLVMTIKGGSCDSEGEEGKKRKGGLTSPRSRTIRKHALRNFFDLGVILQQMEKRGKVS